MIEKGGIMFVHNLAQEFDFAFEPAERKSFLQEVSNTAQKLSTLLGANDSSGTRQPDESAQFIQNLMNELEQDTTEFSPLLEVIPYVNKISPLAALLPLPISPRCSNDLTFI